MKAERFDGYHQHGCHFEGKLVVVHYLDDAQKTRSGELLGLN